MARALIQVDLATTTKLPPPLYSVGSTREGPTGAGHGFSLFCKRRYHHFPGLVSYRFRVKDIKFLPSFFAADR
jgi:hypothetical protein